MKLMSLLWNELKVCNIVSFLNHCISLTCKKIKSVGRRQQKRAQEKSRATSPITPEYPKDIETEGFPTASSTVIHVDVPPDEERSRTPISEGVGKRVSVSSKVTDMTGGKVADSQKSRNVDDERSDDQLDVSQEKAVRDPLKISDLQPTTEPEDSGEGKSNPQKKFKFTAAIFPKFNIGTCIASIIVGC
jgi:hypothetical protein